MSRDMTTPNTLVTMRVPCRQCGVEVVCKKVNHCPASMVPFLFEGSCSNSAKSCTLSMKTFFCCSICTETSGSFRRGKGYITQWKYIERHHQSTMHQSKLKLNRNKEKRNEISIDTYDSFLPNDDESVENECSEGRIKDKNHDTTDDARLGNLSLEELSLLGFHEESCTPKYLYYESMQKGMGARYLTGKAFGVNPTSVTKEEAKFCLQLSSLLIHLTDHQKRMLADILTTAGNNGHPSMSIFRNIRLPSTIEDFERFFITGKDSFFRNLPHPVPQSTGDGSHAYVSLSDLLANEIGKATKYDDFEFHTKLQLLDTDQVPSVSTTPIAKKLFMKMKHSSTSLNDPGSSDSFILYLWIREWRDDFDPNNTKASRNQVWCNTYTVSPPTSGNFNGSHTYYMGISSKGDDHRPIEEILTAEIKLLSEQGIRLYHGGMKQIIRVMVGKLFISVDRPERTTMFQIGDHNGSYSSVWGYATLVDGSCQINRLPSCEVCRQNRVNRLKTGNYRSTTTISDDPSTIVCRDCSDWSIEDPAFVFLAPNDYPRIFDPSPDAPEPPPKRDLWFRVEEHTSAVVDGDPPENDADATNGSRKRRKSPKKPPPKVFLQTVKLTVDWLKSAVIFACHQIKTHLPGGRQNQMYWTKANFAAFLKTCGCTNKLIDTLHKEAANDDYPRSNMPVTWGEVESLAKCHYAPMHMLFLGHSKSNIEMISKWIGKYNKLALFGKEVNKYLTAIRSTRATKFYCAQPLSTSSWGTGVWVSENYLLGVRIWKFLLGLPTINENRLLSLQTYNEEKLSVVRFAHSMTLCFSRIMTNLKWQDEMHEYILLYMDQMVKLDMILLNSDRQKKNPNFVKSNSLGILSVAKAHQEMGPALLHWEGGWEGERKIQQVKPLLGIKRSTADWTRITLRRLYQYDTLQWMHTTMEEGDDGECMRAKRGRDSLIKIYNSRKDMLEDVAINNVLTAIRSNDNGLYLAFRPIGESEGNSRIQVKIIQIEFDDRNGKWNHSRCWTSPIKLGGNSILFESMSQLKKDRILEIVLMLPELCPNMGRFINQYYCIGNLWTERNEDGEFRLPMLDSVLF